MFKTDTKGPNQARTLRTIAEQNNDAKNFADKEPAPQAVAKGNVEPKALEQVPGQPKPQKPFVIK